MHAAVWIWVACERYPALWCGCKDAAVSWDNGPSHDELGDARTDVEGCVGYVWG